MNEIDIRRIDMDHAADANIPNEPFSVWGRMIPTLICRPACFISGRDSRSVDLITDAMTAPARKEKPTSISTGI